MSRRRVSLEEISEDYPIILVDTCALLGKLRVDKTKKNIEEKILLSKMGADSAIFFREFLENGRGFYLTQNILEEYLRGTNYPYKKNAKKNSGNIQGDYLILMRKKRENSKEKRKLTSLLEELGRIFKFEENELEMYSKFSHKYCALMKEEGIRPNGYDLLISGLTSGVKRWPTCIISNDFKLLRSWKKILKIERKDPSQLGFIIRKNFSSFERSHYKKI